MNVLLLTLAIWMTILTLALVVLVRSMMTDNLRTKKIYLVIEIVLFLCALWMLLHPPLLEVVG